MILCGGTIHKNNGYSDAHWNYPYYKKNIKTKKYNQTYFGHQYFNADGKKLLDKFLSPNNRL